MSGAIYISGIFMAYVIGLLIGFIIGSTRRDDE